MTVTTPGTEVSINAFAKQATLMAVEMAAGSRPCRSLSRTFCATAQHRLSVRTLIGPAIGQPASFLSLRIILVGELTYESVALLGLRPDGKVRFVALRISGATGQWQVTAVDVG